MASPSRSGALDGVHVLEADLGLVEHEPRRVADGGDGGVAEPAVLLDVGRVAGSWLSYSRWRWSPSSRWSPRALRCWTSVVAELVVAELDVVADRRNGGDLAELLERIERIERT